MSVDTTLQTVPQSSYVTVRPITQAKETIKSYPRRLQEELTAKQIKAQQDRITRVKQRMQPHIDKSKDHMHDINLRHYDILDASFEVTGNLFSDMRKRFGAALLHGVSPRIFKYATDEAYRETMTDRWFKRQQEKQNKKLSRIRRKIEKQELKAERKEVEQYRRDAFVASRKVFALRFNINAQIKSLKQNFERKARLYEASMPTQSARVENTMTKRSVLRDSVLHETSTILDAKAQALVQKHGLSAEHAKRATALSDDLQQMRQQTQQPATAYRHTHNPTFH